MHLNKILFLSLYTFSKTGGIERVAKNFIDALGILKDQKNIESYKSYAMYDDENIHLKSSVQNHVGFGGSKIKFALKAIKTGLNSDIVVLSHINLLLFAKIVKQFRPQTRVILLAHGIEVWRDLATWKVNFLNQIEIWPVSTFTAQKLKTIHGISDHNIQILNNSLNAEFIYKSEKVKPIALLNKHQLQENKKILLTVARLSSAEQYKGYDTVIKILPKILLIQPDLKYFLVGKADEEELTRLKKLIQNLKLESHVFLTGWVSDDELTNYYQLADVFIMPSQGEGFGIAFIEAKAHGCQVIAGNTDGSVDALLNGKLGFLVNPNNETEIENAIIKAITLENSLDIRIQQMNILKANFSFDKYVEQLKERFNTKLKNSNYA